ncbi:MAG: hypothetical protein K2X81_18385, partial [Candidatus Obscuribacterales bacterium]|nr:hypothetical protein [Candidatus Obscuribacterales bacterium]
PANAQSWSAYKQLAEEQTGKGQLEQAESSWRASLGLAQEKGIKDSRLYISALGLAKIQIDEKKQADARRVLREICCNELATIDVISDEEISCLRTYLELLKETKEDTEKTRIEKLLEETTQKRKTVASTDKPVSLLFGQAAHDEFNKQLVLAKDKLSKKEFAAAEQILNECVSSSTAKQNGSKLHLVLDEQVKLYNSTKDYKKAELAAKQVCDLCKKESGDESRSYMEALQSHVKLLHLLGENDRANAEDTKISIIANKLKAPSPAQFNQPAASSAKPGVDSLQSKVDPSILGGTYERSKVSLSTLMAEADKGSSDIKLLKFLSLVCIKTENYEKAAQYLKQLSLLDPNSAKCQILLGRVYLLLQKPEEALEPAKRAAFLETSPDSYLLLISAYSLMGNMEKEMDSLRDFASRFPDHPKAAIVKTQMQDLEAAIKASASSEYSGPSASEQALCWKKRIAMPIRVFLTDNTTATQVLTNPDGSGAKHPKELCLEALQSWSNCSGGRVSFSIASEERASEITISYLREGDGLLAEHNAAGVTMWPGNRSRALIFLGLVGKDGYAISREAFYGSALHEIGHALGLDHSKRAEDV